MLARDEILAIARRKGAFEVSWRHRDDRLRRLCERLCRDGLLRPVKKNRPGVDIFEPAPFVTGEG